MFSLPVTTMRVGRRVGRVTSGGAGHAPRVVRPLPVPQPQDECVRMGGPRGGLHLGTWNHIFSYRGDEIYVNFSSRCCNLATTNGYRVWAR